MLILWKVLELKVIDLDYFIFSFLFLYFSLFFIIVNREQKKTNCDTITGHMTQSHKSHAHMMQWNNIEGPKR